MKMIIDNLKDLKEMITITETTKKDSRTIS